MRYRKQPKRRNQAYNDLRAVERKADLSVKISKDTEVQTLISSRWITFILKRLLQTQRQIKASEMFSAQIPPKQEAN